MDICHAIKLVRIVFGTMEKFIEENRNEAKWDHIVRLETKQKKNYIQQTNLPKLTYTSTKMK